MANGHGGFRPGSGRKKGSGSHVKPEEIIKKFHAAGYDPAMELVEIYDFYQNNGMVSDQHKFLKDFGDYLFKKVPQGIEQDITVNDTVGFFQITRDES